MFGTKLLRNGRTTDIFVCWFHKVLKTYHYWYVTRRMTCHLWRVLTCLYAKELWICIENTVTYRVSANNVTQLCGIGTLCLPKNNTLCSSQWNKMELIGRYYWSYFHFSQSNTKTVSFTVRTHWKLQFLKYKLEAKLY